MADGSFDASALILKSEAGSFSASALVFGERSGSFGASSYLIAVHSGSWSASALVLSTPTGSFDLSSWVDFGFLASSLFLKTQTASFGISARIREPEYFTPPTVDYEHPVSIVSVTPTNSTLVYAPSHGFVDGQYVYLDVPGLTPGVYRITYVDVDNFTVPYTVPAYATGGVAYDAIPGDKIVIAIDAEDITTDVMYDRTEFVSQANGQAGTCHIAVLDRGRTQTFATGQRIYVTVNDLRVWSGYIMRVKRVYPFVAHSPAERTIEIEGLDVNVLFQKRYVFDQVTFTNGEGPEYPAYTDDTVVLADLFDNYLDLSGDDLDTYSLITHVGTANENQKGYPIKPGESWGETMRRIGALVSPIFYINPNRQVIWSDVDVEDAPFELSDNPGAGQVGVANLSITKDGSSIINDVLLVAAGPGPVATPVSKRLQDATSIADHNRSQFGALISGIWKQATIDRVASTYVNGSPQSLRGHKNDKVSVICTVFQHGLRVGHKVRVVSGVWGFDDVVPIRQLRLRWITPNEPRYDLTITHELDTTWSLIDPYRFPKAQLITPRPPSIPKVPPTEECPELIVFDTFTRTLPTTWGTNDYGTAWDTYTDYPPAGSTLSVSSGNGRLRSVGKGCHAQTWSNLGMWPTYDPTIPFYEGFVFTSSMANSQWAWSSGLIYLLTGVSGGPKIAWQWYSSTSKVSFTIYGETYNRNVKVSLTDSVSYTMKWDMQSVDSHVRWKIWATSEAEPESWSVDFADTAVQHHWSFGVDFNSGWSGYTTTLSIDYMNFGGCVEAGPPPSVDDNAHGYICESFNYVLSNLYTLSNPYVSYTVRVWVDGSLTTDFTEADGTLGTVQLDFDPGVTAKIEICYLVQSGSGEWSDSGAYHGGYIPI